MSKITTLARGQSRSRRGKGYWLDVRHAGINLLFRQYVDRRHLGTGLSYHDFFLAVLIGNLLSVFTLHFLVTLAQKPA